MPDYPAIVRTQQARFPILEFGNGIIAGECYDIKPIFTGEIKHYRFLIKFSRELRNEYYEKIREQDLQSGFIIWEEMAELIVDVTRNPAYPKYQALRTFDKQATEFTKLNQNLVIALENAKKLILEYKKIVHGREEDIRKLAEGSLYIRLQEMIKTIFAEEAGKLIAAFRGGKSA